MINNLRKIKLFLKGYLIPIKIHKTEAKWFGNDYGGFYLATKGLNKSSIIYSIGIGEDISFDDEVIEKFECKVFAYDPTPKSVEWVAKHVNNQNFIFQPLGVANQKGEKRFYLPKNQNHVSGSLHPIHSVETTRSVVLNFDTLSNLMKKNNHQKIDVLKMDIEGAEYEVIEDIVKNKIEVGQILVEFHPHFEKEGRTKTKKAIKALHANGYKCFGRSNSFLEYSFSK